TSRCVYDIPTPLSYVDYMDPERARLRARQHLDENKYHIAGPMPPSVFMDKFFPPRKSAEPSKVQRLASRGAFNAVPSQADTSAEIFDPLVVALNKSTKFKSRCPGFVFDVAATRTVRQDRRGFMKPHVCCYTQSNLEAVRSADVSSRIDLGYAEFFIHVSPDPSRDFFNDPPSDLADRSTHEFLSRSSSPYRQKYIDELFGQHMSYVGEVFARQPRIFVFSVALHGSRSRLLFWDRAGCVVSESFDIRKDPDILCEFLWRFSDKGDLGRGHDVTVQPALSAEEELFRDALREYAETQVGDDDDLEEEINRHYAPGQIYAAQILHRGFSACDENTRRYVFSRPIACSHELSHTGTRGYWAVDVTTKTVVFLKDTWREPALEAEGDILRRLQNLGARNTPVLVWHGDVAWVIHYPKVRRPIDREFQTTVANNETSSSWRCQVDGSRSHLRQRRHYRLVSGTVGRPFSTVRGTKELLNAGLDVLTAMRDALEKDSRLHRDISPGNIVLVKEADADVRKGYLIDWELSCGLTDEGDAEVTGRVGTWRFMSVRLLNWIAHNERKHRFQDDMESLLWVMLYSALMWQPHNYSNTVLREVIRSFFDSRMWLSSEKLWSGGHSKGQQALTRGALPPLKFGSAAFQDWFDSMTSYHSPLPTDSEEFQDKWTDDAFIHQFWTDFLGSHILETANRNEHMPGDSMSESDLSSRAAPDESKSPPFPTSDAEARKRQDSSLEPASDTGSSTPGASPTVRKRARS
ncbi:uncharacterized protein BXZ73DRAFT_26216, partial [Epithele typhae]|uniref:uncharacterized protein n=1 Tax=Epithele typhae TaxID=378194 RepID=UPI002008B88F